MSPFQDDQMGVHLFPKWRAQLRSCIYEKILSSWFVQTPDLRTTLACTNSELYTLFLSRLHRIFRARTVICAGDDRQGGAAGGMGVGVVRNWGTVRSSTRSRPPCPLGLELEPPRVAIPSWRVSKGGVIVGLTSSRQVRSVPPPLRGRLSRGGGYDELMGAGRQDPALLEPPHSSRSRMVPKTTFRRVRVPLSQMRALDYLPLARRLLHQFPALRGDRPAIP